MGWLDGEDADPTRDAVYDAIHGITEDVIRRGFLDGRGPEIILRILDGCRDAVMAAPFEGGTGPDGHEHKTSAVATVVLHYLLAMLLIPSQRKTEFDGVPVDIAIPDTRTLRTDWNSCIVLCILSSTDPAHVEAKIAEARRIQPNRDNIWVVSPGRVDADCHRTFVIRLGDGGDGGGADPDRATAAADGQTTHPFPAITDAIVRFLDEKKSAKFRMFRAV